MDDESIFAEALPMSSTERQAYLDHACADDPTQREEVEALLKSHEEAGEFLAEPAVMQLAIADEVAETIDTRPDGTSATRRSSALSPPPIVGYEILCELGRGGMGVVYKARQTRLGRTVALKMILGGGYAGTADLARFHAEAGAAARLQHPGIVQVHETGAVDGLPYFSTEYVEGGSLDRKLHGTPLPHRAAARLTLLLAHAVQTAHEKGILHRDLKPGNVFLMPTNDLDGVPIDDERTAALKSVGQRYLPKIGDFGLAKDVDPTHASADSAATQTGAIMGTPSYMAPEQASGKTHDLGPAVDIYALGAILYELLTGRPPFKAATPLETLFHVVHHEPPLPVQLQPGTPRDLETICLKCLQKDRTRRYRTAQELADDLQRYLDGRPIQARAVSRLERTWRWCKRNPAVATLLLTVFVVLVTGTAVASFFAVRSEHNAERAEHNAQRAESRQEEAEGAKARAEQAEREKTEKLWEAYLAQARAGRWSGRPGRHFDGLDVIAQAARIRTSLELRNEAIACLALTDVRIGRCWPGLPSGTSLPTLSPTFDRYARVNEGGIISVRRVDDDGEITAVSARDQRPVAMSFSSNGQYLAAKYGDSQGLCLVWNLERKDSAPVVRSGMHHNALDFSLDNCWIALGQANGSINVIELATGRANALNGIKEPHSLAFHPDGKQIAVSSLAGDRVQVVDVAGVKGAVNLLYGAGARGLAWRRDGERLAVACGNNRVVVWNMAGTPRIHAVLEGHEAPVGTVVFNHHGDLLASGAWDGTIRLWDPERAKPLLPVQTGATSLLFSPDDSQLGLMVKDAQLGFWDVAHGSEFFSVPFQNRRTYRQADISPDARWLADADTDGTHLWDLASRTDRAKLGQPSHSTLFHADGRSVFVSGPKGLARWPIQPLADGTRQLGPAQLLSDKSYGEMSLSRDGRLLVAHRQGTAQLALFDLEKADEPVVLDGHPALAFVAVSPDGEWLATGTWHGSGVKIWDTHSARVIHELPISVSAAVAFSPDRKWLVTSTGSDYCFWKTETWELERRLQRELGGDIPGVMAFTSDGSLMALTITRDLIQLMDPRTGELLATLQSPYSRSLAELTIDSRGERLIAISDDCAEIWNLHALRRSLATMNLDWGTPGTLVDDSPQPEKPVRLTVVP